VNECTNDSSPSTPSLDSLTRILSVQMKRGTVWSGGSASESMSMPMPLSIMRCLVMPAGDGDKEEDGWMEGGSVSEVEGFG
jgi:hypothetical protein